MYGVPKLILSILPDFCWQTTQEILTLAEQINENVDERAVAASLARLHIKGKILRREVKNLSCGMKYGMTEYMAVPKGEKNVFDKI